MTRRYVLALDVGPAGSFTALAIVERTDDEDRPIDPTCAVKYLRWFPPGTAYGPVADTIGELLGTEALDGSPVVVDVTAVGTGVLDLLREREPQPDLVAVVVTAGHYAEYGPHGAWLVPKKDLVTGPQLMFQGRRLAIPAAPPEADLLIRELGNFRARVSLAANPLAADWREGQDDDLVLAAALACWHAGRMSRPYLDDGPEVICARSRFQYARGLLPDPHTHPWRW